MTDTSTKAVSVDTSRDRIEMLRLLGCADYIHIALLDERDALQATVAELREALGIVGEFWNDDAEYWSGVSYWDAAKINESLALAKGASNET